MDLTKQKIYEKYDKKLKSSIEHYYGKQNFIIYTKEYVN